MGASWFLIPREPFDKSLSLRRFPVVNNDQKPIDVSSFFIWGGFVCFLSSLTLQAMVWIQSLSQGHNATTVMTSLSLTRTQASMMSILNSWHTLESREALSVCVMFITPAFQRLKSIVVMLWNARIFWGTVMLDEPESNMPESSLSWTGSCASSSWGAAWVLCEGESMLGWVNSKGPCCPEASLEGSSEWGLGESSESASWRHFEPKIIETFCCTNFTAGSILYQWWAQAT